MKKKTVKKNNKQPKKDDYKPLMYASFLMLISLAGFVASLFDGNRISSIMMGAVVIIMALSVVHLIINKE